MLPLKMDYDLKKRKRAAKRLRSIRTMIAWLKEDDRAGCLAFALRCEIERTGLPFAVAELYPGQKVNVVFENGGCQIVAEQ